MANTLANTSCGNSTEVEKVMSRLVGRQTDSLFADQQHEDEGVRRDELLNDGLICLLWLEPRRVQASFVCD